MKEKSLLFKSKEDTKQSGGQSSHAFAAHSLLCELLIPTEQVSSNSSLEINLLEDFLVWRIERSGPLPFSKDQSLCTNQRLQLVILQLSSVSQGNT